MGKILGRTCFVLVGLLMLCTCAHAAQSISAVEYGPWGPWSVEPVEDPSGLEVESDERTITEDHFSWHYSRYVYYNTISDSWFASAREQQGEHCLAGSGRWEEHTAQQQLKVMGKDGGDILYAGNWFNEEVENQPDTRRVRMYRSRTLRKVTCQVSSAQTLLFPEESRQVWVNFFDGGKQTFHSSDLAVASVDQTGLVYAIKPGTADITVRSDKGREARLEVLVCTKDAHIPNGVYTLRKVGTTRAITESDKDTVTLRNLRCKTYNGSRSQRFILNNQSKITFHLHPVQHRDWSVDITRKRNNNAAPGCLVQASKKSERSDIAWRAIAVPDGSYIIYPKVNPKLALGSEDEGASDLLCLESLSVLEEVDRWLLLRANLNARKDKKYAPPVDRNGVSYVKEGYSEQHPGISFCSNGQRVYVLSCGDGTVVEVSDACGHDYPKTPKDLGALMDPCGADPDSPGNYVIIDHGSGVTALYAHLSTVFVKGGDAVRQGSLLGRSGATGSTAEVTLYLETRLNGETFDSGKNLSLPEVGVPVQ